MNNCHNKLAEKMRETIKKAGKLEVTANGDFTLEANDVVLFPGSVYGFATCLTEAEKQVLFQEASQKGLSRINNASDFKPIEGNLYPIYWGKDKRIGDRPYQHLKDPARTGAIRLSTYKALKEKCICCAVVVVNDYDTVESVLRQAFPDLLKTTTKIQGKYNK